jgi:hypothetical protein
MIGQEEIWENPSYGPLWKLGSTVYGRGIALAAPTDREILPTCTNSAHRKLSTQKIHLLNSYLKMHSDCRHFSKWYLRHLFALSRQLYFYFSTSKFFCISHNFKIPNLNYHRIPKRVATTGTFQTSPKPLSRHYFSYLTFNLWSSKLFCISQFQEHNKDHPFNFENPIPHFSYLLSTQRPLPLPTLPTGNYRTKNSSPQNTF